MNNPRKNKQSFRLWLDKEEVKRLKDISHKGIELDQNDIIEAGDIIITTIRRGDFN